jgi:hypothetical protein
VRDFLTLSTLGIALYALAITLAVPALRADPVRDAGTEYCTEVWYRQWGEMFPHEACFRAGR